MKYEMLILSALADGALLRMRIVREMSEQIEGAATVIAEAFKAGNKLLLFGNGGSAADAQHIAAEFVGRFKIERPPLPAIALTTDTSTLTAIANDYSFDEVFARQVKAIGRKGDVALGITTSGYSVNVLRGITAAWEVGMKTMTLTGGQGAGGAFGTVLRVPSDSTPRIQEAHITIGHVICELVDAILFKKLGATGTGSDNCDQPRRLA